ncbi:hypothetical protein CBF_1267 [Clostridium botulinum F str. 230613]|nr:hypothetical protein CBF_1267 [Clostridium botulinum F str. 230613]
MIICLLFSFLNSTFTLGICLLFSFFNSLCSLETCLSFSSIINLSILFRLDRLIKLYILSSRSSSCSNWNIIIDIIKFLKLLFFTLKIPLKYNYYKNIYLIYAYIINKPYPLQIKIHI